MSGSKIKDDKQEYQYSLPFTTPSGHTLVFYDTPDNQRVVLKHTSGSHIEFKADGSVFIKSVSDIHTHGSVVSGTSDIEKKSDTTTTRYDADTSIEVKGRLRIKCSELDLEVGDTARCKAGTDFLSLVTTSSIRQLSPSHRRQPSQSTLTPRKNVREL